MAGGGRPLTRCCKMRCRISGRKGGTNLCKEVDVVKRPIRRGGLRINVHGDLYAPDSEEEELDMEADASPCKIRSADARPCKIRRGGLHMDVHGALYVPDSEEEDSDMEVAANGSLGVVQAAAKKAAEIVATMKLTPEVQERLQAVLANMDPLFHGEFVSMYKILVPIFFKP
ncbi:hypothetical protein PVAP13_9NG372600 [Panicum virgatum]|uniref:Uncharacterized protein n=1 Tax=Panicum virgatum TaxID=38727 RepID=A0A8T0MP22_PANVG|nr:hypothetical protein PVAP13_9NG372600 [Panicum virgatum]